MKTVTKTAEMLSQFDEQEDARLVSATLAMDSGETEVAEAIATLAKLLGAKPSWSRYSMARIRFAETLEAHGKSADAIKSKWSRVCRDSAITIPVSDDPQAQKKAEQRAKARAVYEAKTDDQLEAEMAQLLATPTLARIEQAKKLGKELEQRQKDLGKDIKAELLAVRKAIKEKLNLIDDLEVLQDLLEQLN